MATTPAVTLRGRFPAGTEVLLFERTGDRVDTAGRVVARARTNKASETRFSGLKEGHGYFAVAKVGDEQVVVSVTAKLAPAEKVQPQAQIITPAEEPDRLPGSLDEKAAEQKAEAAKRQEVQPHPDQALAGKNVQQMSDTPQGQATPVDPSRPLPGTKQEDVPKNVQQRSDTPLGEATVVPVDEVQPGLKQEDVPKGTPQRSATPHGEATIIPKGDPIEIERKRYEAPGKDVPEITKDRQPAPRSPKRSVKKRTAAQAKKNRKPATRARTAAKRSASRRSGKGRKS